MDDEQLAARRAQVAVHCAACGSEFPGTTQLHSGICDECQKLTHGPNYRLIAQLQDQERELALAEAAINRLGEICAEKVAEAERLRDGLDMIARWRDDLQTADAARMRTIARALLDG